MSLIEDERILNHLACIDIKIEQLESQLAEARRQRELVVAEAIAPYILASYEEEG